MLRYFDIVINTVESNIKKIEESSYLQIRVTLLKNNLEKR